MQDTLSSLSVSSKFTFEAPASKERGLHSVTSLSEMKSAEEDAFSYTPNVTLSLPLGMGNPCLATQYHTLQSSPVISVTSCHQTGYNFQNDNHVASGYYLPHGLRPNGAPALESPRIEITAYSQCPEDEVAESNREDHIIKRGVNSIVTLTLPNADGYRDPSCLSPASSISSRSCNSEASSYESGFYNYDNSPQNSPWQSPCVSPRGSTLLSCPHASGPAPSPHNSPSNSPQIGAVAEEGWPAQPRGSRPNSPSFSGGGNNNSSSAGVGKRKYSFNDTPCHQTSCSPHQSPTPSPYGSPRVSVTDENWLANANQYTNSAIVAAINALTTDGVIDMGEGIPIKTRKTMVDHSPSMSLKVEPGGEELGQEGDLTHEDYPSRLVLKKENYCGGFLEVPQHPYSWSKPKSYLSPSLPALDWQLPSCSGPYSLQIELQPKSHHRAHYETEGSRGAVKALSGGHPVVQLYGYMESEPLTLQLFIGTADDRLLRPHAFYQVHRITGKTVSTASHEVMQSNTKILEIPLLPENNMRAIIDCAGILKLRNSDIELRKGETDIGRKNTRVRLVFRVHINQPNGRTVSLQAASNPIECSQRSAQELPLVEKQSMDSYIATGGKMIVLSGLNFLPDSKVVFVEKAQDGHHLWETEAKVDKDTVKSNALFVEIPPYRNQRISTPVLVNFYVCNGKRKRSQYQQFTYLPPNVPMIKTEPSDDYDSLGTSALPIHTKSYFSHSRLNPILPVADHDACLASGYPPCPSVNAAMPSSSPNPSPTLHDLSPVAYNKCLPNSPTHAVPSSQLVTAFQETNGRPILTHPASPDHSSPLGMLQTQGSPSHLNNPGTQGFHPVYANSSPSSSPASHASTPSGPAESPFVQAYSPSQAQAPATSAQAGGNSPSLLHEDSSPPAIAITVKQEPQELDQIYLDDVNEIIRNDLSSISVHTHA
ncbi:nuclear factor of activated T-cells, cytoplasmic 1-like isoform X1 [Dunckerocampus dactyliophorus]|uniref:nuclear factor of activated T-cells, cytoplasmic 1-like isoform X1 n=2 Tax=Dunckerocampus dactyliophorus TaxID=161453 RepID=UPI0024072EEB|nr:nuclear factor of activated T-cells, cytoplasmic 1-like isoform X1 [Dunckerocampus dactyliophorus]XP_054638908.1 nuclear factor of activated T-cells, cytoplasmic 1-like isoform X1 [Dunckerocampus dactyliophorus]